MQTQTLHGVSKSKLKQVREDFESEGYVVTTNQQADGKFTVVATKPDADFAAGESRGNVVILNNVPPEKLSEVVTDLTDEGYSVNVVPESDGEFTVISTKSK